MWGDPAAQSPNLVTGPRQHSRGLQHSRWLHSVLCSASWLESLVLRKEKRRVQQREGKKEDEGVRVQLLIGHQYLRGERQGKGWAQNCWGMRSELLGSKKGQEKIPPDGIPSYEAEIDFSRSVSSLGGKTVLQLCWLGWAMVMGLTGGRAGRMRAVRTMEPLLQARRWEAAAITVKELGIIIWSYFSSCNSHLNNYMI